MLGQLITDDKIYGERLNLPLGTIIANYWTGLHISKQLNNGMIIWETLERSLFLKEVPNIPEHLFKVVYEPWSWVCRIGQI